jgi:type II secretory pathway pseudopilin PulG
MAAPLAAALVSIASAQITPPLPSGVDTFNAPAFASNVAQYAADLGDLYFDSDVTVPSSIQTWTNGPVDLTSALGFNPWLPEGGSVKVIFLGETAGWQNDFVYTSSSAPGTINTLITDIENSLVAPFGNVQSGHETVVSYSAGSSLDFWLNSGGAIGEGGLFSAFSATNLFAGSDTSVHTRWSLRNVTTTYFNGTSVVTGEIPTVLIGFEDVRQGLSYYDADFNDFVVGFQFLPTQMPPVPEPSTYGLIGAAALMGIAAWRRKQRKTS